MATFQGQNVQGTIWTTTTMTYWQKEGDKLHTLPEDEQHPPRLVLCTTTEEDVAYSMATFWGQNVQGAYLTTTTMTYWQKEVTHSTRGWITSFTPCTIYNHRGRWCLLYGDFLGTKRSRCIFNHNNDDILTKGSYPQYQRMNNILYALYYLQPQGKMLPTLWQLFRDKTFKVLFEPQKQWHIDKRKLHTLPEDEQHPPCLCITNNHRGRCCLLFDDFFGTKCSRYILNYNNNDILTTGRA